MAGDVEHQRLGLVDRLAHVVGQAVGRLRDRPGGTDEPAQQRVVAHDAGVVGGIGRARCVGLQGDEGGGATGGLEQIATAQLVGHGNRVDRVAPSGDHADHVVDVGVGRAVERVGAAQRLAGRGHRVAGQQHGAEQGFLGLEVVGRHPPPERPGGLVVVHSLGRHGRLSFLRQPWGKLAGEGCEFLGENPREPCVRARFAGDPRDAAPGAGDGAGRCLLRVRRRRPRWSPGTRPRCGASPAPRGCRRS